MYTVRYSTGTIYSILVLDLQCSSTVLVSQCGRVLVIIQIKSLREGETGKQNTPADSDSGMYCTSISTRLPVLYWYSTVVYKLGP